MNHLDQLPTSNSLHFELPPLRIPISTSLTVAGFGFRTIGRLSDRGGLFSFRTIGRLVTTTSINHSNHNFNYLLRIPTTITHFEFPYSPRALQLQENRLTDDNHFDHPLRAPTPISLTVAGFAASGQSADWSTIHLDKPPRSATYFELSSTPNTHINHADLGGLHSFRTIGRLVATTMITHFNQPLQPPTSNTHYHNPTLNSHIHLSHRGGLHSFRTIGRLSDRGGLRLRDNRQTGQLSTPIIHFDHPIQTTVDSGHPLQSTIHSQLPLQSITYKPPLHPAVASFSLSTISRPPATTLIIHFDYPIELNTTRINNHPEHPHPLTSLTVAGSGFRTIGRLAKITSIDHFDQPLRPATSTSLIIPGFGSGTIGRLVNRQSFASITPSTTHPLETLNHFNQSSTFGHPQCFYL
ncbi:hypothetical protein N7527_007266 [Penicillium freii]|nr:hypothetical protein N7527_007266 [Penicillium freii]